jgi:hypothetical protein
LLLELLLEAQVVAPPVLFSAEMHEPHAQNAGIGQEKPLWLILLLACEADGTEALQVPCNRESVQVCRGCTAERSSNACYFQMSQLGNQLTVLVAIQEGVEEIIALDEHFDTGPVEQRCAEPFARRGELGTQRGRERQHTRLNDMGADGHRTPDIHL